MHNTALVEIIRDSNFFSSRDCNYLVEISRSRIIRITNYSAHTYTYVYVRASLCAQLHTHTHVYIGVKEMAAAAICIESDDDIVEPEVENERLNRQSRLHCQTDMFRHLGHGPRCDSDGLGPERCPNGP